MILPYSYTYGGSFIMEMFDLSGQWSYRLDPSDEGVAKQWYKRSLTKHINIPGTIDDIKVGHKNNVRRLDGLTKEYSYEGVAWYQKIIFIPDNWNGQTTELSLERVHWQSSLWIDHNFYGSLDSLSVAHRYNLKDKLSAGSHTITLRIDNRMLYPLSNHHLSPNTQSNWNGLIGEICLISRPNIYTGIVKISENPKGIPTLFVPLTNATDKTVTITLDITIQLPSFDPSIHHHVSPNLPIGTTIYPIPLNKLSEDDLWDEFNQTFISCDIQLTSDYGIDQQSCSVGYCRVATSKQHFIINGKKIFLRGTHDACVFPLTDYPPMDKGSWITLFDSLKSYGLNHFRAHSWCPPEAAFAAADLCGIYLQAEAPISGLLGGGQTDDAVDGLGEHSVEDFIRQETTRIVSDYGHHPSFIMFAVGNELTADPKYLSDVINQAKEINTDILYAQGSNNNWGNPKAQAEDDFFVTFMTGEWEGLLRGSFHLPYKGHINNSRPTTCTTFNDSLTGLNLPVISHEVGQYLAYPDFKEIDKYHGNLKAYNFEAFRDSLDANHMLHLNEAFSKSSGAFQVELYKEEIEAALRTDQLAGFQLLDIKDYPGQGTALCGILDAFGDSKGFVTPEQWHQFCNPIVPLLALQTRTFTEGSPIQGELMVANYSSRALETVELNLILSSQGKELRKQTIPADVIHQGQVTSLGLFDMDTSDLLAPAKYTLTLQINDTELINHWQLWLYPNHKEIMPVNPVDTAELIISNHWNGQIQESLRQGKNVLLLPKETDFNRSINASFQSSFWCLSMFDQFGPSGTLGLLIDATHPVFNEFPTDNHSDWQWWDIARYAPAINLSSLPHTLNPMIRTIDNYERNNPLGILFETNIDKGKLMVSSFDFTNKELQTPVSNQLFISIKKYMASDHFQPKETISVRQLDTIVKYYSIVSI